ncbi:MAG: hypothetical protein ACRCVU_18975 [Flavobacterium sp.]
MEQIYISCSFSMQQDLREVTDRIKEEIEVIGYEPFVFIEHYTFRLDQEKEMMIQAMKDIDESCCLLAETTDKGIGIGIEAGYAKSQGKPVVYIRRADASHSTTMSGLSDYYVLYKDIEDLGIQLQYILPQVKLDVMLRQYILDLLIHEQQTFTVEVLAYLKEYKAQGGRQVRAIETLTALANVYDLVAPWRDGVDDVLDMVTGYCSKEWRVWEE